MKQLFLCVLAMVGCQSQTKNQSSQVKTAHEDSPGDLLEGNRSEMGVCISYKSWEEYDSSKEGTCRENSSRACLGENQEQISIFSKSVSCQCYALEVEHRKFAGSSKEDRTELEELLALAPAQPPSDQEFEFEVEAILTEFKPHPSIKDFYKKHPECEPGPQNSSKPETKDNSQEDAGRGNWSSLN